MDESELKSKAAAVRLMLQLSPDALCREYLKGFLQGLQRLVDGEPLEGIEDHDRRIRAGIGGINAMTRERGRGYRDGLQDRKFDLNGLEFIPEKYSH
jgi:hypothetical protein